MERAEENYLSLPFTARCLPAVENPSQDKAQAGFIMTQEEWNRPLHCFGVWVFFRPHQLYYPGKYPSEGHSYVKRRTKARAAPAFTTVQTLGPPSGSTGSHPGTNISQLATSFTHRSCHIWLFEPMCPTTCTVPVGFVPSGKAKTAMLRVLQVFHTLPPAMLCRALLGEKLESNSNILQMFSLSLHDFIYVRKGKDNKANGKERWKKSCTAYMHITVK